jgi:hypothetical protein
MKSQHNILKLLLVLAITYFSTHAKAVDYQFLNSLKVGQCFYMSETNYMVELNIKRCDELSHEITYIGKDYIVAITKDIFTEAGKMDRYTIFNAQSILRISWLVPRK